jgi:predicted anti-sigma-YlaC factor YlaD
MRMDCEAVREHLDGWALDALAPDEAKAVETNLAGCAECRVLADRARESAAALGFAVPAHAQRKRNAQVARYGVSGGAQPHP